MAVCECTADRACWRQRVLRESVTCVYVYRATRLCPRKQMRLLSVIGRDSR